MVASGAEAQIFHVSPVLTEMCDTSSYKGTFEATNRTFASVMTKCEASGCAEMIPTAIIYPSNSRAERRSRGLPKARLLKRAKINGTYSNVEDKHAWRFVSHLEEQVRVYVALNTIQGSWTSTRGELRTFSSYMCIHHSGESHFPLTSAKLTAFNSLLDNAASAVKYMGAIRKACGVLRQPMPPSEESKMMRAGTRKHYVAAQKSFLRGGAVDVMARECLAKGKDQLARLVLVAYTYQLRVQSEGIPMSTSSEEEFNRGASGHWHSHIIIRTDGAVVLWLRKRKNKPLPSSIVRFCICPIWRPKIVCGACALRKLVSEQNGVGRLFPQVVPGDIKILKDVGQANELGYVTWHGFRRGRTEDVVLGLDVKHNPAASLVEIAETLGHNMRRASFFQYVHGETATRRSVRRVCEDTDSE